MAEYGIPVTLETPRGTLTFNDYAADPSFRLTGFSIASQVRQAVEDLPGVDGSFVPDAPASGCSISLTGEIKASSLAVRADALDLLRAHARSLRRADGILRWTPSGKATRRLNGVRLYDDTAADGAVMKTFQVALVSADPNPVADLLQTIETSGLTAVGAGGVFSFPFSFPVGFGGSAAEGTATVVNGGDEDSFPIVRIYGAVTSPTIRNLTTGQAVVLSGLTLSTGDYAEIDMRAESIYLNGVPTFDLIAGADLSASEFFSLPPGASTIVLSASSFDASAHAEVFFRAAYA